MMQHDSWHSPRSRALLGGFALACSACSPPTASNASKRPGVVAAGASGAAPALLVAANAAPIANTPAAAAGAGRDGTAAAGASGIAAVGASGTAAHMTAV